MEESATFRVDACVISPNFDKEVNNQVLQRIFSFLPLKDLLICRLVCKQWSELATHYVKKCSVLFFSCQKYQDPTVGIGRFLSSLINVQRPCIHKVYLFDIDLKHSLLEAFFYVYGRHITHLVLHERIEKELCYTEFYPYRAPTVNGIKIHELKIILMGFVPNLKILELIDVSGIQQADELFFKWHKNEMTSTVGCTNKGCKILGMNPNHRGSFPNLTSFKINAFVKTRINLDFIQDIIWASDCLQNLEIGNGLNVTPSLLCLGVNQRFFNLKILKLSALKLSDVYVLLSAYKSDNFKLEHFECELLLEPFISLLEKVLTRFLATQNHSLKILKVRHHSLLNATLVFNKLPKMTKLEQVEMIPVDCALVQFFEFSPNIKRLSLLRWNVDSISSAKWKKLFPSNKPELIITTIIEFELPKGMNTTERVIDFVKTFPNVTWLKVMGLEDMNMHVAIWNSWLFLEKLTLQIAKDFKNNTDWIFIGQDKCCVMNLDNLRWLEISMCNELLGNIYSMSNATVNLGFKKMSNLKTLLLPKSKIDKQCQENFTLQMRLDRFSFNYMPFTDW